MEKPRIATCQETAAASTTLYSGAGGGGWQGSRTRIYSFENGVRQFYGSRRAHARVDRSAWLLLFRSMPWSPRWWRPVSRTVGPMKNSHLKSMAIDELWELHEQIAAKLARELTIKKARLEEQLHKIGSASNVITSVRRRRPYPKVLPKYRNPKNPAETWSGRGKQPRWLTAQLLSGKKANDFLIHGQ
jgi:DNA-binding protein H-NS